MRERAELYGGSLAAGPGPEGGFRVLLRLPYDAAGQDADDLDRDRVRADRA
jgi:hypothetical protein